MAAQQTPAQQTPAQQTPAQQTPALDVPVRGQTPPFAAGPVSCSLPVIIVLATVAILITFMICYTIVSAGAGSFEFEGAGGKVLLSIQENTNKMPEVIRRLESVEQIASELVGIKKVIEDLRVSIHELRETIQWPDGFQKYQIIKLYANIRWHESMLLFLFDRWGFNPTELDCQLFSTARDIIDNGPRSPKSGHWYTLAKFKLDSPDVTLENYQHIQSHNVWDCYNPSDLNEFVESNPVHT